MAYEITLYRKNENIFKITGGKKQLLWRITNDSFLLNVHNNIILYRTNDHFPHSFTEITLVILVR